METLEEVLPTLNFDYRRKRQGKKYKLGQLFLHFGKYNFKGGIKQYNGTKYYPEVDKILRDIASQYFPNLKYNRIQINKNVKTERHKDGLNFGESATATIGKFEGGRLGLEDGRLIDTHHKPFIFNGSLIEHYTEEWTNGDRYCIIWYNSPFSILTEHKDELLTLLKPESKNDFMTFEEIFKIDIYLMKHMIAPNEVWIDIGANIGCFSRRCLYEGAKKVIAYEPNERNFQKLKEWSQRFDNVEIHKKAVWNKSGNGILYLQTNGTWQHTLLKKPKAKREEEVIDIIDAVDLPEADGIKIDVEGVEVDIIKRLKKLPNKLLMEYDGDRSPSVKEYNEFIEWLQERYENVIYKKVKRELSTFYPNGLPIRAYNVKK